MKALINIEFEGDFDEKNLETIEKSFNRYFENAVNINSHSVKSEILKMPEEEKEEPKESENSEDTE